MCSSSTHSPTPHRRLTPAIFLFAEPFGGKWVGRCRIFFLEISWEPDLGWVYGLCCRTCAGNVYLSRISGSHSCNMLHDLAPLQNGNEPPEHKNYFLSIGTARHNVYTPRQGPLRVLATGKPCYEKNVFKMFTVIGLGCKMGQTSSCRNYSRTSIRQSMKLCMT